MTRYIVFEAVVALEEPTHMLALHREVPADKTSDAVWKPWRTVVEWATPTSTWVVA